MAGEQNQNQAPPLDLNELIKDRGLNASIKTPENPLDAELRRKKDFALFCFALFVVSIVLGVALMFIFGPAASQDDKKWALAFVASLGSALVGYLVGKRSD